METELHTQVYESNIVITTGRVENAPGAPGKHGHWHSELPSSEVTGLMTSTSNKGTFVRSLLPQ